MPEYTIGHIPGRSGYRGRASYRNGADPAAEWFTCAHRHRRPADAEACAEAEARERLADPALIGDSIRSLARTLGIELEPGDAAAG